MSVFTVGGDPTCATPDPTTDVKLVWTQSTNAFSMVNGSANPFWALGTGANVSTSPTLTGVSGTFTFKFTVGEAMRRGGWTVAPGLANGVVVTATPTVTSNGQTTYSMTAGNFTSRAFAFTLKTTGATSVGPAAGEVTFDCQAGATFTEASATRVGTTSTLLSSAQTPTGTPELGSAVANSCRLAHGGQRPIGTYSFTVGNAVGQG